MNTQQESEKERRIVDVETALYDAHQEIIVLREGIAEAKWIESALRERTRELSERIKELDCLYAISDCISPPRKPLSEILQAIAHVIPSGFQSPESTFIALNTPVGRFCSYGFRPISQTHCYDITANGQRIGSIEVSFSPKPDASDKLELLAEEDHLLLAIANLIGELIELRSNSTYAEKPSKMRPPYTLFARNWARRSSHEK